MIDSKEQYRFVSQEALKRITVKGKPYPKRKQKLVTIGEDEAFLTEAIEERNVILGSSGSVSEKTILNVNRSLDRTNVSVTSFIDPEKFSEISIPQNGKVGESVVSTIYEKGKISEKDAKRNEEASKHYNDTKTENEKKIRELREDLHTSIYGKRDEKGEIIVEGEKDRADKKKEEAQKDYYEKLDKREEHHFDKIVDIENDHRDRTNEILEEGDKTKARIAEAISKETDFNEKAKLTVKYEQVKVEYEIKYDEEELRYEKEVREENAAYKIEKRKLKDEYDSKVNKIDDALQEFIDKNTKIVDEKVDQLEDEIDEAQVYCMQNGGGHTSVEPFVVMKEYNESVDDAWIKHSCTEKFDERPLSPAMASTRMNRVFADLERMKMRTYGGFARRPCWVDNGVGLDGRVGKTFYEEWSRSSHTQGVRYDVLEFQDLAGKSQIHGLDYGVYIGNRHSSELIKRIYADILICRTESKSKVLEKVPYPREEWKSNTECVVDTIFETDELNYLYYKGEKTGNLPDAGHVYYGDGTWEKKENTDAVQWFLKRVTLSKDSTTGGIVEQLDDAKDKYDKSRNEITDKYGKLLEEENKRHEENIAEIQKTYNKAVEDAYENEKKEIADAHLAFVREAYGDAENVNTEIEKAESQKKKDEIIDNWETGTLVPARIKESEAQNEAQRKREQAISAAYERTKNPTQAENERHNEENIKISKEKNKELEELEKKYYGYWDKGQQKHINGIRDNIYEKRQNKVDEIFYKYDDGLESAQKDRDAKTKEALEKLRSNNPYDDEAGTPISEEYKKWLNENLPEEGPEREEFNEYLSAEVNYYSEYERASIDYDNDKTDLLQKRYEALKEITTEDVGSRTLWTGEVKPVGESAVGNPDIMRCVVEKVLNVFVETEPKTLTSVDFSKYYDEIREEEVNS